MRSRIKKAPALWVYYNPNASACVKRLPIEDGYLVGSARHD